MFRLLLAGAVVGYAAYRAGRKYLRGQVDAGRLSFDRGSDSLGAEGRTSAEETSAAARKLRSRAPSKQTASSSVSADFMESASPVATAAAAKGMSKGGTSRTSVRGAHTQEPAEGSRGVIERELKRAGRVTSGASAAGNGRASRAKTGGSAGPRPPQTSEPAEGSRETVDHELARQSSADGSGSAQSGSGNTSRTSGAGVSPTTGLGGVNDGENNPVTGGLP
jgi:hypothetical protein